MDYKQKSDESLKRFAILNSVVQILLLLILTVPMFIYEDYLFVFALIWLLGSGYFMYLTISVKFVDKVWGIFNKFR